MVTSSNYWLLAALVFSSLCLVHGKDDKDKTISIKYEYMKHSVNPTRNENDLQKCALDTNKNNDKLASTFTCKEVTYTLTDTPPCNGRESENDPGKPKAQQCSPSTPQQCYQPASGSFVNAFSRWTNLKPYDISWKCDGKDEFCCGFECCKKRSTKHIWIIVLVVLAVLIGIPCLVLGICCCFCGLFAKCMSAAGKGGDGQSRTAVQDYKPDPNIAQSQSSFNAPPHPYY
ncbi:hypothetical protein PMAYCL1PPCAC_28866 [Pristionchus mayeri]|uniref:CX domain-containing protein n=1 Tax=Pristionchus mayeri TaxID=1317129 RepID=A0AAN5D8A1_9BILA|nr:hypothetical protein PMAYCL1PPCAC_28866 [Pristionchus mayeri]